MREGREEGRWRPFTTMECGPLPDSSIYVSIPSFSSRFERRPVVLLPGEGHPGGRRDGGRHHLVRRVQPGRRPPGHGRQGGQGRHLPEGPGGEDKVMHQYNREGRGVIGICTIFLMVLSFLLCSPRLSTRGAESTTCTAPSRVTSQSSTT